MRDITFCSAKECPSTECHIKVTNNKFEPHEIISIADYSGVCRFYIGWVLTKIEEGEE